MLRVIVVDDEPLARARLRRMLGAADAEVIAEGENGAQAIELVKQHEVDVLVIDINMPTMNGMEAVKAIESQLSAAPAVVFCTAHDEYAVQAFNTDAVAYLLKPFSQKELEQALERAVRHSQLSSSLEKIPGINEAPEIVMHYQGELQKVRLSEIAYFYSHEKSVFAVMKNGDEVFIDYSLKHLEEHYGDHFIRSHRAYLVQTNELVALHRTDLGSQVKLRSCDVAIPVSRRHLKFIKACFKNSL